ncbi:hypothetical protein GE107_07835 [Cohnella sp. CFH 77786]|uniref:DUF6612 family protein n=1 Tax=Cohnella sp. CFH 77786 TaxID=2662265 RepID=UPI001C60E242|nr:DUF6612 family protein [Cohnella sp. CFH 77786]MBW5445969.1 hypothetical protein [Cohnella sp. CFH 77786]
MKWYSLPSIRRSGRLVLAVIAACACMAGVAACASSGSPAVTPSASAPTPVTPKPSASPGSSATQVLEQAREAAQGLKRYAFEMDLVQHLAGPGAEGNSAVSVKMQGRAELGPLKLDQQIKSDMDGQTYSIRAILVPDAYYVYEPEIEEWTKTPKQETAEIKKTLSDFQANPAKALQAVGSLGSGLQTERNGGRDIIRYEGKGAPASAFLENVLESTLDLSGMDPKVRKTIKLESLKVELALDANKHWPLSYKIESSMTVEYEAGKPSTLTQTLSGTYSKHNASENVTVPKAALEAPEPDSSSESS